MEIVILFVPVDPDQNIPCPFVNNARSSCHFKAGTLFGVYEKGEVNSPSVHVTTEIQNNLIPQNDQSNVPGGRIEKLQDIIKQLKLSHLSEKQRKELIEIVLKHDPLFLLEKGELGLLETTSVQINVTDPEPIRGPMYL